MADMYETLLAERTEAPERYRKRIQSLRGFVIEYVSRHGLQATALEAGMSYGGLKKFMDGAEPRVSTVRKLESWRASREAVSSEISTDFSPLATDGGARGGRWVDDVAQLGRFERLGKVEQVEVIREAVRHLVEQTNLQFAANLVGVKKSGLFKFVNGRVQPNGQSITSMRAWFIRSVLNGDIPLNGVRARTLLEFFFLSTFRPSERPAAGDALLLAIERIHADAGRAIPLWLLEAHPHPSQAGVRGLTPDVHPLDDAEAIHIFASVVCADLPEGDHSAATSEVLAAVAGVYAMRERPEPGWLRRARDAVAQLSIAAREASR